MRTLIIGKIWPEPTSSAAGSRTIDLIRSVAAAGWEIHFASAAQRSEHSADLERELGIACSQIELNHSSFDEWVRALDPRIVVFDRFMTEEQFGWRVESACPQALRVIDTSDLHLLREARRLSLNSGAPIDLFNDVALRELACILRSDLTLVISESEYALLRSEFAIDSALIAYWPFVIDPPLPEPPPYDQRRHCAMIGSFLHEPNWDAARWCREAIWPLIRAALPDAECHLYGSYPPPKAQQLQSEKLGFFVKGRAPEAVATLAGYRLNLAPLRFGAGLKGKLADGFRAGTPNIATAIAAEGMAGDLPWGSPVADDAAGFAEAAIALYRSELAWTAAQRAGFRIAQERFARKRWEPTLPAMLVEAHAAMAANRHRNVLGRMLRSQERRSAEYMSRWIEAKNRPPLS